MENHGTCQAGYEKIPPITKEISSGFETLKEQSYLIEQEAEKINSCLSEMKKIFENPPT